MQFLYKRLFPIVLVLLFFSGDNKAKAQSTATLQGVVMDTSGAVIPGAHIKIHSTATNAVREVISDDTGKYFVPSLQPGTYNVVANAAGFGAVNISNLVMLVDQTSNVDIKMGVAATGETVQVEGNTPVIDAGGITVGQAIDQKTVQNIPLNGRHFLDLTALVPGSVTPPTAGNLTDRTSVV